MAKRPTPKKKLSADRSGHRYGAFLRTEWRRLRGQLASPFAGYAKKKDSPEKALEKVTRIKA